MEQPKSQGAMVAELLSSRIAQLEIDKAILMANLEIKTKECDGYKNKLVNSIPVGEED